MRHIWSCSASGQAWCGTRILAVQVGTVGSLDFSVGFVLTPLPDLSLPRVFKFTSHGADRMGH